MTTEDQMIEGRRASSVGERRRSCSARSIIALLVLIATVTACSHKAQECSAVEAPIATVRGKLDLDVNDDKAAPAKATKLDNLMAAADSAKRDLSAVHVRDSGLAERVDEYQTRLADLVTDARAVKGSFDEQAGLAARLAAEQAAQDAVKKAIEDLGGVLDGAELSRLADLADLHPDPADEADALEKVKFRSDGGQLAARKLIDALRAEAKAKAANKDLTGKLSALESSSKAKRKQFADARVDLRNADDAIVQYCTAK